MERFNISAFFFFNKHRSIAILQGLPTDSRHSDKQYREPGITGSCTLACGLKGTVGQKQIEISLIFFLVCFFQYTREKRSFTDKGERPPAFFITCRPRTLGKATLNSACSALLEMALITVGNQNICIAGSDSAPLNQLPQTLIDCCP